MLLKDVINTRDTNNNDLAPCPINQGLESGFEVIVSLSFKPRILLPLSGGSVTNETISDPRASAAGGVVDKCKGFDLADNLQLSIQEFRTNPSSLVLSLTVLETIRGNILPTFVARRYSFYKNYRWATLHGFLGQSWKMEPARHSKREKCISHVNSSIKQCEIMRSSTRPAIIFTSFWELG